MRAMGLLTQMFRRDFRSADYWTRRYAKGKTSGAGSYGVLADYKAGVINTLAADREIASVIEFGSGDGNQASLFAFDNYTGVDVVAQVAEAAARRFAQRPGWRFVTTADYAANPTRHDMAMSLDVIYHLVEDAVFDGYMRQLTGAARRFVLVYASDHDAHTRDSHVRHRAYSQWIAQHAPEFELVQSWDNPHCLTPEADRRQTTFAFFRLFARKAPPDGAGDA